MIRHIVAFDRSRGIAKHGVQPWMIPSDEQYFSDMTKEYGGIVLMGRTTFEVIGGPLKNRQNFVLTHDAGYAADGATVLTDLDGFLRQHSDVWVIGGAKVYEATLGKTDELYITHIDATFGCDTFYPEIGGRFKPKNLGEWQEENGFRFRFATYVTKRV